MKAAGEFTDTKIHHHVGIYVLWICQFRFHRHSDWRDRCPGPGSRVLLAQFGMRALLAGTLASLLSATIIGVLMG